MSCIGCATPLSDCQAQPTFSEKPAAEKKVYYYNSCNHFLCSRCMNTKKSLGTYCLLCDTVHLLGREQKKASTSERIQITRDHVLPTYQATRDVNDEFVIGEEEEEVIPAYEVVDRVHIEPIPVGNSTGTDGTNTIHYLRPEETLVGLALKYRVDARLLCTMNGLPYSTTSTTPHLLHTLPFLILPAEITHSLSSEPIRSAYDEHKRLTLHRFQIKHKIASHAEAKAYLDGIFLIRKKEFEGNGSVGEIRMGGEIEEAGLNYETDKAWEKENGPMQKGKGKMSSKSAKSWSFM